MSKKVLLKDIAAAAGVSPALVSYVMNNRFEGRIGKDTAEKIREVARQLDYRPNQIAKSLKTNKTFTIGLMLGDITNPFSYQIARIIEDEAKKYNYTVIFGNCDEQEENSKKLMDTLLNRQVDGFIIAPAANTKDQLHYLESLNIPFVLIDRYFPGENFNHIIIDNQTAAFNAADHLAKHGRKRIAIINYETALFHLLDRTNGYRDALAKNGIAFRNEWLSEVDIHNTRQGVQNAVAELIGLPEPVDAIFAATNALGIETLKQLNHLQVRVPDNLAIVCFDETDAVDLFYSPLTYIRQPMGQLGSLAVQTLLKLIEGKVRHPTQIVLDSTLVVNKSSGGP